MRQDVTVSATAGRFPAAPMMRVFGCAGGVAVLGIVAGMVREKKAAYRQMGLVFEYPKVRIDFLTVCDGLVLRLP